jgi:hypothetical protein
MAEREREEETGTSPNEAERTRPAPIVISGAAAAVDRVEAMETALAGASAERITGPSPSGVSTHSRGHPSSAAPTLVFDGWQEAGTSASIALWPSPATQSTVPAGAV